MTDIAAVVADNIHIWTGAIQRKSSAGRGGGGKRISLYGIERLRALILDLAVRGRLVPQDAGDEPASELLKRLGLKPKSSPELPTGWAEATLSQLGVFLGGITPSKGTKRFWGNGVPWVSPKDMGDLEVIARSEDEITQAALDETSLQVVPVGALLMVARSGILRRKFPLATTAVECTINQDMKAFIPRPEVSARYIQVMLMGFQPRVLTGLVKRGMTVESLIFNDFVKAVWPIPPQAEQRRIVAKVDELMALCDALERESADAIAAHQVLVEALLATLVNSVDAVDLARQWARLESQFDTLFTTDASIDALRQTILDLAVRGKLVEQDAEDEPADKMLAGAKMVSIKGGSKAKPHPAIKPADQSFRLPPSWQWERFDNLIQPDMPIAYGVLVPGDDQVGGIPFVRIADLSITDPPVLPEKAISPEVDAQFERTRIKGGEILMGVVGSIGKLGVAPSSWAGANIARAICRIVPASFMDRAYVLWLLQSRFMQDSFKGDTRTLAQPTLNLTLIRLAATPVPPLAEQRRIVAKVDALMALCDALKARLSYAAQTQRHLADALTERAAA